ncbi:MAG: hypothetical protein HYY43_06700 [Deltaproteobacteria bacterium]|nr:hypothetical protein [Deltaproteobacteria bacterium]
MSEPEKIKEKPPIPPEPPKEAPQQKTSQSAFDKIMEQQRILKQNPLLQGKVAEQDAEGYRIKEIAQRREEGSEKQKKEDRDESGGKEKTKSKQKESGTVTKEAVVRGGEKKGFGQSLGGGGRDKGGFSSDMAKKQVLFKKVADGKGLIDSLAQGSFASKLASAKAAVLKLDPKQMQTLVNQIVQAIHIGKTGLGEKELRLILREHVFAGLRLRFTSNHGKVSIQFETADRKVKDLFTAEAAKIKSALEEKGIAVAEIKVS